MSRYSKDFCPVCAEVTLHVKGVCIRCSHALILRPKVRNKRLGGSMLFAKRS